MAVNFANVQLRPTDASEGDRRAFLEAIGESCRAVTDCELVDDAERADFTVAIGPVHGAGWIGMYLRQSESDAFPSELVEALGSELAAPAAGFFGEGNRLRVRFWLDGRSIGDWDSKEGGEPDFSAEPFEARFLPGASEGAGLAECWDSPPEGADRMARAFGRALQMEPALAAAGYGYVTTNVAGEVDVLHFRQRSADREIARISGTAEFESAGRVRELEASKGGDFQASASFGNRGGRAKGVAIRVGGEAVERGLVEIETIRLTGGTVRDFEEAPVESGGSEGERREVVAEFPEATVEGALAEEVDLSELSPERRREVMQAHRASRISVYVRGNAIAPGEGDLRIGIAPIGQQPSERAEEQAHLAVYPRPRVPVPADPETAPPHTLRQMQKPETLFALLHFDRSVDAWVRPAAKAIRVWNEAIADSEGAYTEVTFAHPGARPNEKLVQVGAFDDEEGLVERVERMGRMHQYSAILEASATSSESIEPGRTGGFSYFSLDGPASGPDGTPAPALGFWVGLSDKTSEEGERLRECLREVVDALARSGGVIQAISGAWAWTPATSVRNLPYEIVTGLPHSNHLNIEWLGRYLRAATPLLWLGPELWGRLEVGGLEAIADIEELGPVRRLTLRDPAERDAYEEALAPILPDAEAWSGESD